MLSLDLDELEQLDRTHRLFSVDRPNLFSLRTRDFLPLTEPVHQVTTPTTAPPAADAPSLKQRVLHYLRAHEITVADDARVELITLPRMLGYRFNPVSFYYVRDTAGSLVAAIVEVTNTFHEMKPYLLTPDRPDAPGFHRRVAKNFYVSPFSDVDVAFDLKLRPHANRLTVAIDDYEGDRRNLATTITGHATELTDRRLATFLFTYPLLTFRVIFLIHWHALRLWLKRVPWFAKRARAAEQTDLYRPHPSLTTPASRPSHLPSA